MLLLLYIKVHVRSPNVQYVHILSPLSSPNVFILYLSLSSLSIYISILLSKLSPHPLHTCRTTSAFLLSQATPRSTVLHHILLHLIFVVSFSFLSLSLRYHEEENENFHVTYTTMLIHMP